MYRLSTVYQRSGAVLTAVAQVQAFPAAVKQSSFIMISCAGNPKRLTDDSMDAIVQARVLTAKQKGEAGVRQCGLAYTVIRPGPLVEEPGGYRGLVFDQVGSSWGSLAPSLSFSDEGLRMSLSRFTADVCCMRQHNVASCSAMLSSAGACLASVRLHLGFHLSCAMCSLPSCFCPKLLRKLCH